MLRTGKQVWEASAKRSALGIRQAELDFHISRYAMLITQCSFLVGFAMDAVVHIEIPEGTHFFIADLFFGSLSLCIMFSVYVVVAGSCLIIMGQQLALLGSEGESLERAVYHLRSHRFSLFLNGFLAFFMLIAAGIALAWLKMGNISVVITLAFGVMIFCTLSSISSIYFALGNRELVTGETKFYTPNGHFDLATLQPNVAGPTVLAGAGDLEEPEEEEVAQGNGRSPPSYGWRSAPDPLQTFKRMLAGEEFSNGLSSNGSRKDLV